MHVRLLGPVEASVDGRVVAIGAGKPRALLALLALHNGSTVSSERLIEGLWGEQAPATATKLIQLHVSQLRKAFGPAPIVTRSHGYELRLDDLDVTRFERLVAARRAREALALWRGPPLDDVAEPFAAAEIRRLEELRLTATELAIEIDLAAGRHREVVGELERLVLEEPLRETLHHQRMLALYRSGRQADALEAYRQARAVLVERLGIEPGPALRELHAAVLRQDESLESVIQRVGEAAKRVTAERPALRLVEDDLVSGVVELQVKRERPEPDAVVCPFKGLSAYGSDDAGYFFGRERLVAELVARLAGAPLLGIVGPSGSGKSSAMRAGLLPALAAGVLPGSDRWNVSLLRPPEHPPPNADVVAVDQFEQLFTRCVDEEQRRAFVDALTALPRVVIAVRADFYGRCSEYPQLARRLADGHVLVRPMRRDELRRAIELPAQRSGLEVEPELVDALLADVAGRPGALPLLSTTLLELWQHRDGRHLRLADYEHAGGVEAAVARLAERAFDRVEPEQRPAARRVLLRLAGDGDAAVRVPLRELDEQIVQVLAGERLVTIAEGDVEVAHEALLREWPRLRIWLEEDAHGRRLHRHLRETAHAWDGRGRDDLYRGARLAAILDWSQTADLTADEREFVAASRAASQRSQRRLRALVAGLATLLALAVAAGAIALDERAGARAEATAAEAQRLGARALVEDDLDLSLLLARQGVALDDSPQTRANLLAALLRSPAAIGALHGDGNRLTAIDLSRDGRRLAFIDNDGTLSAVDLPTRRATRGTVPGQVGIIDEVRLDHLRFSPNGSRLAIGGEPAVIVDARTLRAVTRLALGDEGFIYALRYAPDGRTLLAAIAKPSTFSTVLQRFDARTGKPIGDGRRVSRGFVSLMLSADGERVITTGAFAQTTIHDARTLRPLTRWRVRAEQAALSPDDRTLLAGGADGSVRFLDLTTGDVTSGAGNHAAGVERAVFSRDSRQAVSAATDGSMFVWDVQRASVDEALEGHAGKITGLTVSGSTLYTSAFDGKVLIWDLGGAGRLGRMFHGGLRDVQMPRFALSPDGRNLASGGVDGTITIIDARTLRTRASVPVVPDGPVRGMAYVPGGRLLVVGGDDGFLALVDPRGRVVKRLPGQRNTVYTPSFSANGRLMATGSVDRILLYALPSGRLVGRPYIRSTPITDVSLSPDGRTLAVTRPEDQGVEIRDAPSLRIRTRLKDSETIWDHARFTRDGRFIVGASWKGWAQLWSTETWRPVGRRFAEHAGRVDWESISPDGDTLATGSSDGTVRLWDLRTQLPIGAPLRGLPNRTVLPQFTPDGAHLFAIYGQRAFRWDVRPPSWARHACAVAGRTLTRSEWQDALPGRAYEPACTP
jgi:WD40 repeat protein/DNA-binding SARP family transcriptional activator